MGTGDAVGVIVRVPLYAAGALVGVQIANTLRPVAVNPGGVVNATGLDFNKLLGNAIKLDFGALGAQLSGAASRAGTSVETQIHEQVRANVIMGVVGGCLAAGLVDWLLS